MPEDEDTMARFRIILHHATLLEKVMRQHLPAEGHGEIPNLIDPPIRFAAATLGLPGAGR